MRIAILEDDQDQAKILQNWLKEDGHNSFVYTDAATFKRDLKHQSFDLAILDWILPQSSGLDTLVWLRENLDWHLPIVFLTMHDKEQMLVEALDKGADDYLVKPPSKLELLARINAVARRHQPSVAKVESFGDYRFDREHQMLYDNDKNIPMSGKEFELSYFLFKNAGRLVSRDHILETVWGSSAPIQTRKVDTYISRIRSKLNSNGDKVRIASVYQRGYRLEYNPKK